MDVNGTTKWRGRRDGQTLRRRYLLDVSPPLRPFREADSRPLGFQRARPFPLRGRQNQESLRKRRENHYSTFCTVDSERPL